MKEDVEVKQRRDATRCKSHLQCLLLTVVPMWQPASITEGTQWSELVLHEGHQSLETLPQGILVSVPLTLPHGDLTGTKEHVENIGERHQDVWTDEEFLSITLKH